MWPWFIMADSYWWVNISQPPLDVCKWLEEPLIAYLIPLRWEQCLFFQKEHSNFKQNNQILSTRSAWEMRHWIVRTCIHCFLSVYQTPSYVREWLMKPLTAYLIPLYGQHCVFSNNKSLKFQAKFPNLGHQISLGNVILCHKDRHPLLLECFLAFLSCIWMVGRALIEYPIPLL